MGLFQKIKSALGLDGSQSSDARRAGDVDVTVEREPSTEDEDAVKGTDTASETSGEGSDATSEAATTDESPDSVDVADAEPDTVTETVPDDEAEEDADEAEVDEADEGSEVDETDTATEADDEDAVDDVGTESEDEAETEEADDGAEEPAGSPDPVTELNGIGPAYADRLAGQGIETVGELAAADAAAIAAETDLGEKRVEDWISQAKAY
jgi:predicted flap endonuclease-1-like 5' DNA nuclease